MPFNTPCCILPLQDVQFAAGEVEFEVCALTRANVSLEQAGIAFGGAFLLFLHLEGLRIAQFGFFTELDFKSCRLFLRHEQLYACETGVELQKLHVIAHLFEFDVAIIGLQQQIAAQLANIEAREG